MDFVSTPIDGAFVVTTERHSDSRGWFARAWCDEEFADQGLAPLTSQASLSMNERRLTLRGMHWQTSPSSEAKLVRPVHGAIHDVIVDLRPTSPSFGRWWGVELSAQAATALYVPPQCAHGFLTLADHTLVHYSMSSPHAPTLSRGFRWNDPAVGIDWPAMPSLISDRDRALPELAAVE